MSSPIEPGDYPEPVDWHMYYVRDRGLRTPTPGAIDRLGEIDQFAKATFVLRLNDVGSFVIDADSSATGVVDAVNVPSSELSRNVQLVINGQSVFLGPILGVERRLDATGERIAIFGADQNAWLSHRVCLPTDMPFLDRFSYNRGESGLLEPIWPGDSGSNWVGAWQLSANDHRPTDNFKGPAGQAISWYVDHNLGQSAVAHGSTLRERIVVPLPGPPLGDDVTLAARFQNLLEFVQGIAIQAGEWPLGFNVTAWGLNVWQPVNHGAVFSTDIGNVKSYLSRHTVDDANWVYVAGQGEGESRQIANNPGYGGHVGGPINPVYPNLRTPPIYGRVEQFRDRRDTNEWPILSNAAVEDCRAGIKRPTILVEALDTATQRYGRDYDLGDLVNVRFAGNEVQVLVTALTFNLEAGRHPIVVPTLGTDTAVAPLSFIQRINRSNTRINQLERR